MRQILLALICLSVFAFAQNVLAISPAPTEGLMATPAPSEAVPPAGSMALLFAGLAGLTAAGRRIEGADDA